MLSLWLRLHRAFWFGISDPRQRQEGRTDREEIQGESERDRETMCVCVCVCVCVCIYIYIYIYIHT